MASGQPFQFKDKITCLQVRQLDPKVLIETINPSRCIVVYPDIYTSRCAITSKQRGDSVNLRVFYDDLERRFLGERALHNGEVAEFVGHLAAVVLNSGAGPVEQQAEVA